MNRVTTSVMQSAGAIDKTIDREFDEQERNFKVVEQRIENLHRELKGYLDAVRKMTVAQHAIAETIDLFYDESDPLQKASQAYKDAMVSMDEEVRGELDHTYRATVMEPVGKLVGILPFINDAIKKRNKKLLDYDRAKSTVRKIVEKPSEDPSKLAKVRFSFHKGRARISNYS
jgi:bridging integrator 3